MNDDNNKDTSTAGSTNEELVNKKPTVVTIENVESLERIQKYYRSPSFVHTIRLMIEDVDAGIKDGTFQRR